MSLKIKINYWLGAILLLGAILRFWGIFHDLPLSSSVGDEVYLLSGSFKMMNDAVLVGEP